MYVGLGLGLGLGLLCAHNRVPIFSDYVSRSLRPWSLKWLLLALFLPSERAPGVLIVRRRESGRGLGPSLPYVITARLPPPPSSLALAGLGMHVCRARARARAIMCA